MSEYKIYVLTTFLNDLIIHEIYLITHISTILPFPSPFATITLDHLKDTIATFQETQKINTGEKMDKGTMVNFRRKPFKMKNYKKNLSLNASQTSCILFNVHIAFH